MLKSEKLKNYKKNLMKLYLLKGYVIINSIDIENTSYNDIINWIKENKDKGKILTEFDISDFVK